eukprot:82689-Hanusia_phi.AAC.1
MGIVVTPRNQIVTPTPHPHPSRVKNHPPIKIERLVCSKPPVRLLKEMTDHPTLRMSTPPHFMDLFRYQGVLSKVPPPPFRANLTASPILGAPEHGGVHG